MYKRPKLKLPRCLQFNIQVRKMKFRRTQVSRDPKPCEPTEIKLNFFFFFFE